MKKIIRILFMTFLTLLWLAPLYFVVINACKDRLGVVTDKAGFQSASLQQFFINVKDILTNPNLRYLDSFITSIIITTASLALIIIISSMAAWVLVRVKTKTSKFLFMVFVGAMVIPFQVVMLPLVSWFSTIGVYVPFINLTQSMLGMLIAYMGFGCSLTIFMYHGFIKSVPVELEEAAYIDGASRIKTFFLVVFPILKPITITLLILNGIWIWNDFLLPLVLLGQGGAVQTVPVAIANFIGSFVKQWELIMTSLLLTITPIMILYIFAQKYIMKGMVEGSVK